MRRSSRLQAVVSRRGHVYGQAGISPRDAVARPATETRTAPGECARTARTVATADINLHSSLRNHDKIEGLGDYILHREHSRLRLSVPPAIEQHPERAALRREGAFPPRTSIALTTLPFPAG